MVLFLFFYLLLGGRDRPLVDEFAGASFKRTIVAIGDIHSYYPNALKALQLADVVDSSGKWTGKVDLLAQTGDLVDRSVFAPYTSLLVPQRMSQGVKTPLKFTSCSTD